MCEIYTEGKPFQTLISKRFLIKLFICLDA